MPALVLTVFNVLTPIVKFDIFDSIPWREFVFGDDDEESEDDKINIPDQIQSLGIESHSMMENLGSVPLFCSYYLIKVLFVLVHPF